MSILKYGLSSKEICNYLKYEKMFLERQCTLKRLCEKYIPNKKFKFGGVERAATIAASLGHELELVRLIVWRERGF